MGSIRNRSSESVRASAYDFVSLILTYLLASLLMWASVAKATYIQQFQDSLLASYLVPRSVVAPFSVAMIAIEAIIAVALILPKTRSVGSTASLLLSGLFVGYGMWRLLQNIGVPCSCFGPFLSLTPLQSLIVAFFTFIVSWIAMTRWQKLPQMETI